MESCLCTCSVYTYIVIIVHEQCTYSEAYLIRTSKGTQNQYLLSEVLTIRVGLCTYMRYTQGQNEEYRSMHQTRY